MPISLSQILSVALALAVTYYVLGLIVSTITKFILDVLNTRGKSLEKFLQNNLLGKAEKGKSDLLNELKKMPQLNSLKPVRYATYGLGFFGWKGGTEIAEVIERIPPKNLVDALFDFGGTLSQGNKKVREVIGRLPDRLPGGPDGIEFTAKKELMKLADSGFTDVEALRAKMETWFTGLMDQAAQQYKAQARRIVIILSVIVTLVFGVDSIDLAKKYWGDAATLATANAQADLILASHQAGTDQTDQMKDLINQLQELNASNYGWYQQPGNAPADWLWLKLAGLAITALAVSQGSSFWYDLMKQINGGQTTDTPGG